MVKLVTGLFAPLIGKPGDMPTLSKGGGAGVAPYDPSFYGWDENLDEGTDGDWFVDASVSSSGDGTTPETAFKTLAEAFTAMSGGDTIRLLGDGVKYRSQHTFAGKGGASESARTKLLGYATDKPVLTGAEVLSGLVPCVEADEPIVGPNWASMYKIESFDSTSIASSDPRALNLHEAGVVLNLAMEWNLGSRDPFWTNDVRSFHTATNVYKSGDVAATSGAVITGFKKTSITDLYTQAQIENAEVVFHVTGNATARAPVDSFDPVDDIIRLTTTGTYTDDSYKDSFALSNLIPAMTQGGYGFVDNGDGTCDIYVWPRSAANVASGIEYSARDYCINLADADNIEIASLQVVQCAGVSLTTALGIRDGSVAAQSNVTVRNVSMGKVTHIVGANDGGGVCNFSRVSNAKFWNCTIRYVRGTFGVYAGSGSATYDGGGAVTSSAQYTDLDVRFNDIQYVEQAPVRVFYGWEPIIAFNRLWNNGVGVHANKMNFYVQCHNVLAWGNDFTGSDGYATWQDSDNLFWAFNYIPASLAVDDGRSIQDQNDTDHDTPSVALGDAATCLLFNNHCPPDRNNLTETNAITVGDVNYPQVDFAIYNTVAQGIIDAASAVEDEDYNVNTSTTAVGAHSVTSSPSAMYDDPANGNFAIKSDAPVRTMVGKDMRELIATVLIPRFGARFSDWSLDISRNVVDWTDAPVGEKNHRTASADVTAPTISSLSPTDGASDVSADASFTITFSEPVVSGAGNVSIYDASDDSLIEAFDVTSDVTMGGLTASFTPTDDLAGGDYYIQIDAGAFEDISGNAFAGIADETAWNFTVVTAIPYVTFDGTNDYLSKTGNLTGAADSRTGLLFMAVTFAGAAAAIEMLIESGDATSALSRQASGVLRTGWVAADTTQNVGLFNSSSTVGAEKALICMAIDANGTSRLWLWKSGAWALVGTDATGASKDIDWTRGSWTIAAAAGGANKFNGAMARVALWTGLTLPDTSTDAFLADFADEATGDLVDPSVSIGVYGTPLIDIYGDVAFWNNDNANNNGSGGGFVMNGTVT